MKISSAVFMRGARGSDDLLDDGIPQIAFIGRANVGKSSLINSFTGVGGLAVTSSSPGRTQELNIFLINKNTYFVDLPGYGYAKTSFKNWEKMNKLIYWYLLNSDYDPKVVLIIDANVGPTKDDLGVLKSLEERGKEIIVVANKVDKIKSSQYLNQMKKIREQIPGHLIMPYSSTKKIGIGELSHELLGRR